MVVPFHLYKSIKLLGSPIFIVDDDNDSVSSWSEASKGWIGVAAAAADAICVTRARAAASACVAVRHHRVVFKVDVGDDAADASTRPTASPPAAAAARRLREQDLRRAVPC